MGQIANVLSFAAGYVAGSESARRSLDAARRTLDDFRARADVLRGRADEVRARADMLRGRADEVRARVGDVRPRADRLLASTARSARIAVANRASAIRIPGGRAPDPSGELRALATSALDRAARAVDLADAAIRRVGIELTSGPRKVRPRRPR